MMKKIRAKIKAIIEAISYRFSQYRKTNQNLKIAITIAETQKKLDMIEVALNKRLKRPDVLAVEVVDVKLLQTQLKNRRKQIEKVRKTSRRDV